MSTTIEQLVVTILKRYILIGLLIITTAICLGCAHDDEIFYPETIEISPEKPSFSFKAEVYARIPGLGMCQGKSFQGMSTYNDYAFCFYDTGICRCVDLISKEIISEFCLPDEAHHNKNHAGVACFSEEFYQDDDEFPLLYLSSYQEYKCYVLRMFKDHAEIVQTLLTNTEPDSLGKRSRAPIIGYEPDGDKLLLKIKESISPLIYKWITVYRPQVSNETRYINLEERLSDFSVPSTSAYNAGFAYNGKLYQLAGYTQWERKLYIIDYINKEIIIDVRWDNRIINDYEQEQCSRFKNGILINYNKADKLVYVEFKNFTF